jgi:hypothetical protein
MTNIRQTAKERTWGYIAFSFAKETLKDLKGYRKNGIGN